MHIESDTKNADIIHSKRTVKGTVISECKQCGGDYTQPACRAKRDKFCSKSCGIDFKQSKKNKSITECPFCGVLFKARSTQLSKGKKPFCSISCGSKSQDRGVDRYIKGSETRARNKGNHNYPKGSEVHNWRGGKAVSNGYIMIFIGVVDGKRKYIPEHRLVVEMDIGRSLLDSEIIHHINEIRDDNRIANLQIMSRGEHASHHALERTQQKLIDKGLSWLD